MGSFGSRDICWIPVWGWKEDKVVDSGGKKKMIPPGLGPELWFYKSCVLEEGKHGYFWGSGGSEREGLEKDSILICMAQLVEEKKNKKKIAGESEISKNWQ